MNHPLQSRHMPRLLVTVIACAALIAACGNDDEGDAGTAEPNAGATASQATGEAAEREGGAAGTEGGATGDAAESEGEAAGTEGEATGDAAEREGGTAGTEGEATGAEPDGAGRAAEAAAARRGPLVTLRDSQFGPVLFDGHNRALYLFTRDPRNRTRCYGACAEAWPPFYAKGRPRAGRGVDRDLLGTIKRRDGRRQVTYKGQALYFYVDDPRGQVLCNDVFEFGGTWYAVDAKGNRPA
jgi:predicted lipoprotein with Yx(FWY)xxD motif